MNTLKITPGISPGLSSYDRQSDHSVPDSNRRAGGINSPQQKNSTPAAAARLRRDAAVPAPPATSSDQFADYVLNVGQQTPLTAEQADSARLALFHSIPASRDRLADRHTADMTGNTLLDALKKSPTFRAVVSYGLNRGVGRLDDVTYRNEYSGKQGSNVNFGDITIRSLQASKSAPIISDAAYVPRDGGHAPYIVLGAAPNGDSTRLPAWQTTLIHEGAIGPPWAD
jgi:hypothetical protein